MLFLYETLVDIHFKTLYNKFQKFKVIMTNVEWPNIRFTNSLDNIICRSYTIIALMSKS